MGRHAAALFATAAVFHTEKTNAKTTDATTGATVLAGDQQVTGVEFGLSGNLTSRWGVFAGLSLMDGTIKESLVAAEVDRRLSYVPRAVVQPLVDLSAADEHHRSAAARSSPAATTSTTPTR